MHRPRPEIEGEPVPPTGLPRLAVLIDAEYVTANFAAPMFDELTAYGAVTIRRAYGDWTSPHLAGWTYKLEAHAITPVQRFAGSAGRSSIVSAIVIDALDLMHSGRVDGLAIVCNDGAFTPLATRLREGGATVVGLGRSGTARAFMTACDDYVDLDSLTVDDPTTPPQPAPQPAPPAPRSTPAAAGPGAPSAPPRTPLAQPTPGEPTPGQPTPGQPAPGQPTPGQPAPTRPTAQRPAPPTAQRPAPSAAQRPAPSAAHPPGQPSPPSVPSAPDQLPELMSDTLPTPRRDSMPAYTGKHRA